MKEIHDIVRACRRRPNESFVLATLVDAHGSSYRRPGARMLIDRHAQTVGSLSGGCLEEEVAERAREIFQTQKPLRLSFDTRRRFGCNGSIEIFVEPLRADLIEQLSEQFAARKSCTLVTDHAKTFLLSLGEIAPPNSFVQEVSPQPRLFIFGDGPDSPPLRSLAITLGWEVIDLIDTADLPEEVDDWTAVVIKSHNYGRDFVALQKMLARPLRYLGLIGPRRRRDQLLGDLADGGVSTNAELFAPTGLDLRAETPEEIALAIIAEIQAVFAGGSGESLRDSKRPIHHLEPVAQLIS